MKKRLNSVLTVTGSIGNIQKDLQLLQYLKRELAVLAVYKKGLDIVVFSFNSSKNAK